MVANPDMPFLSNIPNYSVEAQVSPDGSLTWCVPKAIIEEDLENTIVCFEHCSGNEPLEANTDEDSEMLQNNTPYSYAGFVWNFDENQLMVTSTDGSGSVITYYIKRSLFAKPSDDGIPYFCNECGCVKHGSVGAPEEPGSLVGSDLTNGWTAHYGYEWRFDNTTGEEKVIVNSLDGTIRKYYLSCSTST